MDYIKGFTYGFMAPKGSFATAKAKESIKALADTTKSSYVIFALAALQDTPQSIVVDYQGDHMVTDEELCSMIDYARDLGLKVILKPLVNVRNGTWRAHINFFDVDVPCEPKWSEWFASYTKFQVHYAKIAQEKQCEMLIVGCEMVQTNRRSKEWRSVIAEVRKHYFSPVSYNADKYQEDRIDWWDAVDVISSSGYYPTGTWKEQLDRIESVVRKFNKPFFFAEAGCMSLHGSKYLPNNWGLEGTLDLEEQAAYYREMFEVVEQRKFVEGFGLWDWPVNLQSPEEALIDTGYGVYGKPSCQVIHDYYSKKVE